MLGVIRPEGVLLHLTPVGYARAIFHHSQLAGRPTPRIREWRWGVERKRGAGERWDQARAYGEREHHRLCVWSARGSEGSCECERCE